MQTRQGFGLFLYRSSGRAEFLHIDRLVYFGLRVNPDQALVCICNRENVDASRGRIFHCKMAKNRLITVVFSNRVGLIHLAI